MTDLVPSIAVVAIGLAVAFGLARLLDAVNAAIAVQRDNAIIASMAVQFGLTSEQIDDLFRTAATL